MSSYTSGGDLLLGSAYIVDHPWEYGFDWDYGPISRGIGVKKIVLRESCPYICVTADSLPLFLATFGPKMVAKALRGTSIKVQTDRVNRDLLKKDRTISDRDLMLRQVSSILLGVVTRTYWGGGNVPQVMYDGKLYPTKAAADAASKVAAKNTAIESARSFLVDAQDAGIPAEVARTMARKQWPLAFETAADTEPEPDTSTEFEDEDWSDPVEDLEV